MTFALRRSGRRAPSHRAVAAEVLESRTLLTAYVVDSLEDVVAADGRLTLREAILAANGNAAVNEAAAGQGDGVTDSIVFAPSIAGAGEANTIRLTDGPLVITDDDGLSITGPVRVSGEWASRVFVVAGGARASFYGLTIVRGYSSEGGGIYNAGGLSLRLCVLAENFGTYGGAILNAAGAGLSVSACGVRGNAGMWGDGLFNNGVASVEGEFSDSSSPYGVIVNAGSLYFGGRITGVETGIYNTANGDLRMVAASIRDVGPRVNGVSGSYALKNFGAADLYLTEISGCDDSAVVNYKDLTISGSRIRDSGHVGSGGGGVVNALGGNLRLVQSVVSGNTATNGAGIYNDGSLAIVDCLVTGNRATRLASYCYGGGLYNAGVADVSLSVFSANTPTYEAAIVLGGGIFTAGTLTVSDCTFEGNVADQGGGLYASAATGAVVVTRSTFTGNRAEAGGAIVQAAGAPLAVYNSTISGNRAAYGGGVRSTAAGAGAASGPLLSNVTIFGNRGEVYGGGLLGDARLTNTIVAGNRRGSGAAGGADDVVGTVSGTNNLIGDAATAGGLTDGASGNVVGVDWRGVLDPVLRNNGGRTATHALVAGGAAIDAGAGSLLATDQRGVGFPRQVGAGVDIGAFEYGAGASDGGSLAAFWERAEEKALDLLVGATDESPGSRR